MLCNNYFVHALSGREKITSLFWEIRPVICWVKQRKVLFNDDQFEETNAEMFVYLRLEKTVRRISNVTLQHCYKPSVGTFTEERVEPALWFKVLVIDSILVDCELRTVYINYEKNHESDGFHSCRPEELKTKLVVDFFKRKGDLFFSFILLYKVL